MRYESRAVTRKQVLIGLALAAALLVGAPVGWSAYTSLRFPSDRTPEGAYVRITMALGRARLEDCFPYLETEAQHALFTIHDFRKRSLALVRDNFEEPEKSRWIAAFGAEGDQPDPAGTWAVLAKKNAWDARLRRDVSGIRTIERVQERATIETVQGTRYTFRRAENDIWGLTLFTAELVAHKERAARDFQVIERAAQDYARAKGSK